MEQSNIFRTVNRYWNGSTATGDPYPGQSTLGYTGQPPQYAGQLGIWAKLSYSDAQKRSDPAASQSLQSGRYQYVQFAADSTNYALGQILYWKDETNYIVTNVPPTNLALAGTCLSAVTQGNYWLMQTSGVAAVLFAGSLAQTTAGSSVLSNQATPAVGVTAADATAIVAGTSGTSIRGFLGIAKAALTISTVGLVYLRGMIEVE